MFTLHNVAVSRKVIVIFGETLFFLGQWAAARNVRDKIG